MSLNENNLRYGHLLSAPLFRILIAVVLCSALLAWAQLAAATASSSPQAEHPPYGIIVMAHGGNDE